MTWLFIVQYGERVKAQSESYRLDMFLKGLHLHPGVHNLLKDLRNDEISEVIKKDYIFLHIASFCCYKYLVEKHLNYHSRQKLRQLARLFITIKADNPEINEFQDCFNPNHFRKVIAGVQKLCALNTISGQYQKPALANHLGIYLKEACNILHSLCIIKQDVNRKEMVTDFKNLIIFEYGAFVARAARKNIEVSKWNCPNELPLISDIKIFKDHLTAKAEVACEELTNCYSYVQWKTLIQVSATLILLFNRKRPGEVERMLLSSFHSRQTIEENSDEYKSMSTLERLLSKSFKRVEIWGKRGRRVAILLRDNHIRYINTFLKYRFEGGVSGNNIYLFGFNDDNHVRLNQVISNEASLSDATKPELLRATLLRKQVATTSQLLDLNDNEMQLLADFLGHDIQVHKSHYRTPELTLQIAQLSKFLLAVDSGQLTEYKGKNFKDLNIEKYLKNQDTNNSNTDNENDNETDESNILVETVICRDFDESAAEIQENLATTKVLEVNPYPLYDEFQNTSTELVSYSCTTSMEQSDAPDDPKTKRSTCAGSKRRDEFIKGDSTPKKNKIMRLTWRTPEKFAVRQHFKFYLENHTLPSLSDVVKVAKKEPRLRRRTPAQIKAWINNEHRRKKLNFD